MQSGTTLSECPRVLLVDDNAEMLDTAAAVLSSEFEIVGTARDGRTALDAAGNLRPDVIVLDISMPGMCGLEVATRLKAEGSTAAVVFLTVLEDEEVVRAAKDAGAVGYVLKPRLASELPKATFEASEGRRFISTRLCSTLW
jgi:DNA-binding NarL/FixJ family response regulator